jgi:hypothetical protein
LLSFTVELAADFVLFHTAKHWLLINSFYCLHPHAHAHHHIPLRPTKR